VKKNLPLSIVFHGWAEPTYDFSLLRKTLNAVNQEASRYRLNRFRYIATNGAISRQVAEFLAENFEQIGLSCDGPPRIQNKQRPMKGTGFSSRLVERTADIFRKSGARFTVRSTITQDTLLRQEEIAAYIIRKLKPQEIRFEAAYASGQFQAEDAVPFSEHFQKARLLAAKAGVPLTFSGSRLDELHGPYCNIFRNVLNLIPGNRISACFVSDQIHRNGDFDIGQWTNQHLSINYEEVRQLKHQLWQYPKECDSCINLYHCVKLCPDVCSLDLKKQGLDPRQAFRCRLQLLLALQQIKEAAARITLPGMITL
jgi:sulfatase maturation enzyme AslB (radical SAM superfamily)